MFYNIQKNPSKIMKKFEQKYRIIDEIGHGAEGVCYRIEQINTDQIYAMKKIQNKSTKSCSQQIDILSKLHHPNIVELIDFYDNTDATYLIMEYFPFSDLQKQIESRQSKELPFQEDQIFRYLHSMLLALDYLHGEGIVHRDIKPGNIMINADGQVKLGDMGAAKQIDDEECKSRVGTPYYLAPQIIKNEPYTYKADIWSLGCTIYYLAAFRHPFQGQNLITLGSKIVGEDIQPLDEYSEELNIILREMLCKDAVWRPSAKTLLQRYFQQKSQNNEQDRDGDGADANQIDQKQNQDQVALNLGSMSSNQKSESDQQEQIQNDDKVMELHRKSRRSSRMKMQIPTPSPIENEPPAADEEDEVLILKATSNAAIGRSSKNLIRSYIALENGKVDPTRKSSIRSQARRPSIFKMISGNAFANSSPTPSQRSSMPLPQKNQTVHSPAPIIIGAHNGHTKSQWASSSNIQRRSARQDSAIMRKDKHIQIMKGLKKFKNAKIKKKNCENRVWEEVQLLQPQLIIITK